MCICKWAWLRPRRWKLCSLGWISIRTSLHCVFIIIPKQLYIASKMSCHRHTGQVISLLNQCFQILFKNQNGTIEISLLYNRDILFIKCSIIPLLCQQHLWCSFSVLINQQKFCFSPKHEQFAWNSLLHLNYKHIYRSLVIFIHFVWISFFTASYIL